MQRLSLLVACALLTLSAGCAHDAKPTVLASTVAAPPVPATSTMRPGQAVALSAELRKVCGIDDVSEAPRFDFDAAALSPADRSELSQLARCMTTGPLAGKSVQLVGRADPRGEAEYNMTLGEHRGESVVRYLGQLGVPASRLPLTSRGALDAQGHDDATWALDRRVDLRLVGR